MLIKAVTKKGEAVTYSPEESLLFAVEYGVKSKNTLDKVFWVPRNTIKKSSIHFNQTGEGEWEAMAEGTADIGYTDAKTDRFFVARPHKFSIQYKPTKDSLGLPDITVVSFSVTPLSQNPAELMNAVDKTLDAAKTEEEAAE